MVYSISDEQAKALAAIVEKMATARTAFESAAEAGYPLAKVAVANIEANEIFAQRDKLLLDEVVDRLTPAPTLGTPTRFIVFVPKNLTAMLHYPYSYSTDLRERAVAYRLAGNSLRKTTTFPIDETIHPIHPRFLGAGFGRKSLLAPGA